MTGQMCVEQVVKWSSAVEYLGCWVEPRKEGRKVSEFAIGTGGMCNQIRGDSRRLVGRQHLLPLIPSTR